MLNLRFSGREAQVKGCNGFENTVSVSLAPEPFISTTTFSFHVYGMFLFQGRQEGVSIDPWEDADYSIYKVMDRFGFLQ